MPDGAATTVDPPAPPTSSPPEVKASKGRLAQMASHPTTALFVVWVIAFCFLAVQQERFLTEGNLRNIIEENAVVFIVAIATTMIVLMGGIDLSSGGLLALTGLVLTLSNNGSPEWLAVLLTILAAGVLGGVVNGLPIGKARMNPFVVTLGALTIFRGLANVFTDGSTYILSDASIVTTLSTGSIGPIPVAAVVMATVFALFYFLLQFTFFGRDIYAIGGNQDAAALAGVKVARVKITAYALVGLVVGLASVMAAGRLGSVAPSSGSGLELIAVAAVLLGGTSLGGGKGTVVGTAVAVLFLGTVSNGLRINAVSSFWEDVVTGVILIIAVGLGQARSFVSETRGASRRKSAQDQKDATPT